MVRRCIICHYDCRGHTGAMMTLGGGTVSSFSRKQKLNGKSSTEAELIGMDDALPQIYKTYQDTIFFC